MENEQLVRKILSRSHILYNYDFSGNRLTNDEIAYHFNKLNDANLNLKFVSGNTYGKYADGYWSDLNDFYQYLYIDEFATNTLFRNYVKKSDLIIGKFNDQNFDRLSRIDFEDVDVLLEFLNIEDAQPVDLYNYFKSKYYDK